MPVLCRHPATALEEEGNFERGRRDGGIFPLPAPASSVSMQRSLWFSAMRPSGSSLILSPFPSGVTAHCFFDGGIFPHRSWQHLLPWTFETGHFASLTSQVCLAFHFASFLTGSKQCKEGNKCFVLSLCLSFSFSPPLTN